MAKKPNKSLATVEPTPLEPKASHQTVIDEMKGLEKANVEIMQEGQYFRAMFLGMGGHQEFTRDDGSPDLLPTWRFETLDGSNRFRILGSTMLDRELEAIEKDFALPVEVGVSHKGQEEIGGGRRMNMFDIFVDPDAPKKPPQNKPADSDMPI